MLKANPANTPDAAAVQITGENETTFIDAEIADVVLRPLKKFHDERGWLAELFRHDSLAEEFYPAMSYASMTKPGVQRGPHEHVDQADLFCFFGPSNFRVCLWDNRPNSPTYRHRMTLLLGQDEPAALLVPLGVVHTYRNDGDTDGLVINCPNRLYRGPHYREPIDEIRHEDDPNTIYQMNGD